MRRALARRTCAAGVLQESGLAHRESCEVEEKDRCPAATRGRKTRTGKMPARHVGHSEASMSFETTHSLGEHVVLLPDAVPLVNGRETKKQSLTRNTKDCKLLEASAMSGHLHAGEILPAQVDPSHLVPELILRDTLALPRLRPVPNALANIAVEKRISTRNINSGDIQLVFSHYDSFIYLKLEIINNIVGSRQSRCA